MNEAKKCCRCLQYKSFAEFGKERSQPDGLKKMCRECRSKYEKISKSRKRYCVDCGAETQGIRCKSCAAPYRFKNRKCSIPGCNEKHHAKDICSKHYDDSRYEKKSVMYAGKLRRKRRNGGYWIDNEGYKRVFCPCHPNASKDGFVREHRLAMEIHLSRFLKRNEHVHHKDGNKLNNAVENLEILTRNRRDCMADKTTRHTTRRMAWRRLT